MIYGSVCSGIEAATVAWDPLGWKASFFSEIEKFPRAVLKHHYPDIPLHGDFTTIKENDYEPVELLVGGTPCQSFSVAGLRKGLDDDRGNLALEYLRLAQRLRPTWLVWENVPGVLSSNGGRDFGAFIGGLEELGYGWSYRTLDAQYAGVPQRRRRIFVVGYLGDWRPPAAVLFERHSLSGNTPPSRKEGERVAGGFEVGPGGGREAGVVPTLDARCKDGPRRNQVGFICYEWHNQDSRIREEDVASTLNTNADGKEGNLVQVVHGTQDPVVSEDKAHPLGRNGGQENVVAIQDVSEGGDQNGLGIGEPGAPSYTLLSRGKPAVAFTQNQQGDVLTGEVAPTMGTNQNATGRNTPKVMEGHSTVRRLTPRECERLQGFPDDYTRIPWRGKKPEDCPDGPRYKALGNSMAVPVMYWIGKRIEAVNTTKGGGYE